jgi:hypothetical protein
MALSHNKATISPNARIGLFLLRAGKISWVINWLKRLSSGQPFTINLDRAYSASSGIYCFSESKVSILTA